MSHLGCTDLSRMLDGFQGLPCWHTYAGGVGPQFSAHFGDKIPRPARPWATRKEDGTDFEKFRGYASLMIWCPWRLDCPRGPIVDSDQDVPSIRRNLETLVGATIRTATVSPVNLDLLVEFDSDLTLRVFCEPAPAQGEPDLGISWSCYLGSAQALVGLGYKWRIVVEPDQL